MHPDDERLLSRLTPRQRMLAGVPDPATCQAHELAASLVAQALADVIHPEGVRVSPLGAGWSSDIDVHVRTMPDPQRLLDLGWIPLDRLFHRLRYRTDGRWAITAAGHVLAGLDLQLGTPPDAARAVIDRCYRKGKVRLREVLELRTLQREGIDLGEPDPVLALAADLERHLGGDALSRYRSSGGHARARGPTEAGGGAALRRCARSVRRLTRSRVVVALAGVDGAGKSTVATGLANELQRAGVPTSRIWQRPGMGTIEQVSRSAKRVLRVRGESGVQQMVLPRTAPPPSRRGAFGWSWALVVTVVYLVDVWRCHLLRQGVLIYDRHLPDALVTMGFVYATRDRGLHAWLLRHLMPRAHRTYYIDIDEDLALARKTDPVFGPYAVREQLARYRQVVDRSRVVALDARRPVEMLVRQVLEDITSS